ncbi:MAG: hypothetical protein QXG86_00225 [Candidatus Woesearchaeota archaeon]
MKITKRDKEYILEFLMQGNSLYDSLEILANICENLNLTYLNPRIKHFRYFQFTFFGFIVKVNGIIDRMIFRADFLKNNIPEFGEVYSTLKKLKNNMEMTYKSISEKEMVKGKNQIIELYNDYSKIFAGIIKICKKLILV